MRIPEEIQARDLSVEVHLGGAGFGEGILVVFGHAVAIGIDCCLSFVQRPGAKESFIERQIKSLSGKGLLFWILTHFHHDHFHCLSSLLSQFSADILAGIFPLDITPADLSYLKQTAARSSVKRADLHIARDEYHRIRQMIDRGESQISRHTGLWKNWLSVKLKVSARKSVPLQISTYGPPDKTYQQSVGRSSNQIEKDPASKSRSPANRGSYIVHCRFGRFEALLMGDAGTDRFEQLKASKLIGEDGIDCLKVGHHGSFDGTSQELLDLCSGSRKPTRERHALIAPFKNNNLPEREIIDLLKVNGFIVHVSGSQRNDAEATKDMMKECSVITKAKFLEVVAPGKDIVTLRFSA